MTKIAGSGSASESRPISQMYGSADPDPDPDPPQNVMDPQHCLVICNYKTGFKSGFIEMNKGISTGSVLDPDPHRSALIWLFWIQIRNGNADPDPGGRTLTKIIK